MITKIGLAIFGLFVMAQLPFNTPSAQRGGSGGGGVIEFQRPRSPQGDEAQGKGTERLQQDRAYLNSWGPKIKRGCNGYTTEALKKYPPSVFQRYEQAQGRVMKHDGEAAKREQVPEPVEKQAPVKSTKPIAETLPEPDVHHSPAPTPKAGGQYIRIDDLEGGWFWIWEATRKPQVSIVEQAAEVRAQEILREEQIQKRTAELLNKLRNNRNPAAPSPQPNPVPSASP